MNAKKWVVFLGLCGLIFGAPRPAVVAQDTTPPLPADLIFTTGDNTEQNWWGTPHNVLMWVDAQTGEARRFYVDPDAAFVIALGWSPQGDLLAVYRESPPDDPQSELHKLLCLVDRQGVLKTCFEETPDQVSQVHYDGTVTWSPDGQKIYYASEYPPNAQSGVSRIVEADVTTGETLNIIYEYPFDAQIHQAPSSLGWSCSLDKVLVGVMDSAKDRQSRDLQTMIVDLATGAERNMGDMAPEHTELFYVCPQVSPLGTYLAMHVSYKTWEYAPDSGLQDYLEMLVILDTQGIAQVKIGEPDGANTLYPWGCPVWAQDEKSFYLLSTKQHDRNMYLFKYSLSGQKETIYTAGVDRLPAGMQYHPLTLSPDDHFIALQVATQPYGGSPHQVIVLDSKGQSLWSSDDYPFAMYPVWVPPYMGAGAQATVHVIRGDTLNVRDSAGLSGTVLEALADGTAVTLLEGPQTADGYVWWRVRTPSGVEGWAVESANGVQTLITASP
jgi:hypothetical protein